jgi:hypothetical protein
MRRLAVVFSLLLTLSVAASASAAHDAGVARSPAHLAVTKWSTHQSGDRVTGTFVVVNRGRVPTATGRHVEVEIRWTRPSRNGKTIEHLAPTIHLTLLPVVPPGGHQRTRFSTTIPESVPAGNRPVVVCTDTCLRIGWVHVSGTSAAEGGSGGSGGAKGTGGSGTGATPGSPVPPLPVPPSPPSHPISTVPTDPLYPEAERPFRHVGGGVEYWGYVPSSYDASNRTLTPLLIWLHGCYGEAEGEAWVVDPGEEMQPPQDWLTLTLAGREGGAEGVCWVPSVDEAKVMAALADFETHFNVDRRRVILGGYSSGGDLAYRTGFRHSSTFAGLLIENSSPFRDTESTEAESLAAATTKLHIVHLAHLQDETYGIEGVRSETNAVKAAGFPLERIEVRGEHWNDPGEIVEGHAVPGTDADLRTYLLPHIDDGWLAPAP